MQLRAYITINGTKPTRSLLPFSFENAKVEDLCTFVAEKCFCPPGSTYKVSVKALFELGDSAASTFYAVSPEVTLEDNAEMIVVVDPPSGDAASFQLPVQSPSRHHSSQSQPSTPLLSQATSMDASLTSCFEDSFQPRPSSQRSLTSRPAPTVTAGTSNDAAFLDQINALLSSQSSSATLAADTPATLAIPATTLLLAVYFSQRQAVEDAFLGMKPDETILLSNVDVHAFFDLPVRKSALHVLQNPMDHSMEIRDAAKSQAKKSLVELLVKAYPDYNSPSKAIQPVTEFLAHATGNDWFLQLTTSNGTNLIMNAFKKRKSRYRQSIDPKESPRTPGKKKKISVQPPIPEDLDAAAVALARCSSAKEMHDLVAETAPHRCTWIGKVPMLHLRRLITVIAPDPAAATSTLASSETNDEPVTDETDGPADDSRPPQEEEEAIQIE
uniref:Uncharacterized protein n=1 Tax=Panagrolaimus superbus TaxID=310955 RepID=A0A914Z9Y0_9BILA